MHIWTKRGNYWRYQGMLLRYFTSDVEKPPTQSCFLLSAGLKNHPTSSPRPIIENRTDGGGRISFGKHPNKGIFIQLWPFFSWALTKNISAPKIANAFCCHIFCNTTWCDIWYIMCVCEICYDIAACISRLSHLDSLESPHLGGWFSLG